MLGWCHHEFRRLRDADSDARLIRLRYLAAFSALLPCALALYVGLRIADLWRPVRMGTLNPKGRISIMVSYIDPYLRQLQSMGLKTILIVINPGACPNSQLAAMYARVVWLIDDRHPWLRRVMQVTYRAFVVGSSMDARLRAGYMREFRNVWQASPALSFTAQEQAAGRALLARLGLTPSAPYVCWGVREAAYYRQFLDPGARRRAQYLNTEADEDTYIRNPPLGNYLPMLTQCAEQGLYVVRMGQVVGAQLPSGLHPNVVDYAAKHRSPFGDIYLLATCKFAVSGGAGLWNVVSAFNRPVVLTDSYFLQYRPLRQGDLFIPKMVWLIAEKRFLTFKEMLTAHMRYTYASNCRRDGVELLHSTPGQIAAVVREMNERLDGTWCETEEDQELQRRFSSLYTPDQYGYGMPGRIGAEFLRQHAELL